jgi:serine/threonine protein kinase
MPRLVFVWLLALLVMGCARSGKELPVTSWSMSVAGGPPTELTVPAHLEPALPEAASTYELRTTVHLPDDLRGKDLVFAIPAFRALGTLTANGIPAVALDESAFDRYRRSHPLRFRILAASTTTGHVDLVLTIQHRWIHSGWIDSVPIVADAAEGTPELVATDDFNRTAAIAAFATASFVALLYGCLAAALTGPRRRTFGLFAAGAILNLSYPALLLGITQPLLGVYEVPIGTWMLIVGAVCATYFAKAYFGLPPPHAAWRWFAILTGLAALLARDPFQAIRVMGPLVVIATMANTGMQFALVMKLRHERPRRKNLYLISLAWPMTSALGAPDFMGWMGWGEPFHGVRTACIGMTVISLLQAFALLRDHLGSLSHADSLNTELASRIDALEAKQQEVELLNDELRRQIAARSRQLVDSLAKTDGTMEMPRFVLLPGDVVENRYRIVRLLGEGGMGAVHEVERLVDGNHFAMKLLSVVNDPVARARFAREAQIAANVKHTNVVSLVDFDVAREGFLFLVMELVEGATLREVRKRALDVPWTLFVLAQVADGLDAIHAQGIVHRDLKPANVLISRGTDGRRPLVKITDFGVSSLIAEEIRSQSGLRAASPSADDLDLFPPIGFTEGGPTRRQSLTDPPIDGGDGVDKVDGVDGGDVSTLPGDPLEALTGGATREEPLVPKRAELSTPSHAQIDDQALTRPGIVFGTPNYMAAELVDGKATRAADIFSLGVIAFELMTLRRPFEECPLRAAIKKRTLLAAPPLLDVVPGLDPLVATLLDRALLHEALQRPTARELAEAFRSAGARGQAAARPNSL